jgi:ankyrin repeat protein
MFKKMVAQASQPQQQDPNIQIQLFLTKYGFNLSDVNAPSSILTTKSSALAMALEHEPNMVQPLLEKGADPKILSTMQFNQKQTQIDAFSLAALFGRIEEMKLMFVITKSGIDTTSEIEARQVCAFNSKTSENQLDLLAMAVIGTSCPSSNKQGCLDIIDYLVQEGFEVNKKSGNKASQIDHHTPLYIAVLQGSINAAQKLIALGANPSEKHIVSTNQGGLIENTPFTQALSSNVVIALELTKSDLFNPKDVDSSRNGMISLAMEGLKNPQTHSTCIEIIKAIVAKDPTTLSYHDTQTGRTCLEWSLSEQNYPGAFELLLEADHGRAINSKNPKTEQTTFMVALQTNPQAALKMAQNDSFNTKLLDNHGNNALSLTMEGLKNLAFHGIFVEIMNTLLTKDPEFLLTHHDSGNKSCFEWACDTDNYPDAFDVISAKDTGQSINTIVTTTTPHTTMLSYALFLQKQDLAQKIAKHPTFSPKFHADNANAATIGLVFKFAVETHDTNLVHHTILKCPQLAAAMIDNRPVVEIETQHLHDDPSHKDEHIKILTELFAHGAQITQGAAALNAQHQLGLLDIQAQAAESHLAGLASEMEIA